MKEQILLAPYKTVTIFDRVKSFKRKFPMSHICVINSKLEGIWVVGNTYRGSYSDKYYGAYPHSYLERVLSLFPDKQPFHLFSGLINDEFTLDIKTTVHPSICADAHFLPVKSDSQELIIGDPPYTDDDSEKYGTLPIKRFKIFRECYRILKLGGFLVWLDLLYPQFVFKDHFHFKLYGLISVVVSTMHRVRLCTILQKTDF